MHDLICSICGQPVRARPPFEYYDDVVRSQRLDQTESWAHRGCVERQECHAQRWLAYCSFARRDPDAHYGGI